MLEKNSNANDCSPHFASLDSLNWKMYATGDNCDTTAQQSTIEGALTKYVQDSANGSVCGVVCLKMTHGGTWAGFITLAAPGYDASNYFCDDYDSFGSCASGGEKDS